MKAKTRALSHQLPFKWPHVEEREGPTFPQEPQWLMQVVYRAHLLNHDFRLNEDQWVNTTRRRLQINIPNKKTFLRIRASLKWKDLSHTIVHSHHWWFPTRSWVTKAKVSQKWVFNKQMVVCMEAERFNRWWECLTLDLLNKNASSDHYPSYRSYLAVGQIRKQRLELTPGNFETGKLTDQLTLFPWRTLN